jgi:hypothetical protein
MIMFFSVIVSFIIFVGSLFAGLLVSSYVFGYTITPDLFLMVMLADIISILVMLGVKNQLSALVRAMENK